MSAWIVSDRHIDVIVRGLCRRELVNGLSPNDIGRELWRENVKSIHHRYPDTAQTDDCYPGTYEGWRADDADRYEYQVPADSSQELPLLLNSLASYDYQTCEHLGYRTSRAHDWVVLLRDALKAEGATRPTLGDQGGSDSWSVPWREEEALSR